MSGKGCHWLSLILLVCGGPKLLSSEVFFVFGSKIVPLALVVTFLGLWLLALELGVGSFEAASELPLQRCLCLSLLLRWSVFACAVPLQNCLCGHTREQFMWHLFLETPRCFLLCSTPSLHGSGLVSRWLGGGIP